MYRIEIDRNRHRRVDRVRRMIPARAARIDLPPDEVDEAVSGEHGEENQQQERKDRPQRPVSRSARHDGAL